MPAMFNVKHLALTDLIFLLMLILQIGNCAYFSGATDFILESKAVFTKGKMQSSKCINNGFGERKSF